MVSNEGIELKSAGDYPLSSTNDENDYVVNKDTEHILKNKNIESKWYLGGVNILVLSVIIFSVAVTFALVLNIIFGNPQASLF